MRINVHIIMGINEDSSGLANYLKQRKEVVYICDSIVKGVNQRKDFTYVDQKFIESLDPTIFKVYGYEPPYKKGKLLQETMSFVMEKKKPSEDDETL